MSADRILSAEEVAVIRAAVDVDRVLDPLFLHGMRRLLDSHEALRAALDAERAKREQAEADLVAMREALRKYGRHGDGCWPNVRRGGRCVCGYVASLAASAPEGGEPT